MEYAAQVALSNHWQPSMLRLISHSNGGIILSAQNGSRILFLVMADSNRTSIALLVLFLPVYTLDGILKLYASHEAIMPF